MAALSRVLRWLFCALLVIAAAAALYALIWLVCAFVHDLNVPRYPGWQYILFK